jgi:putative restriction endonuclease
VPDLDWELRLAAFARLEQLTRARGGIVTSDDLNAGFAFGEDQIKFWSSRRGIWRPKQLSIASGAALSITTTPPTPGKKPPYADQIVPGAESFVYRYEGNNPATHTNVAVRVAMEQRRPLIYFIGMQSGQYAAIWPCYVIGDRPEELAFEIQAAAHVSPGPLPAEFDVSAGERRYATRVVMQRLHQYRFRQLVVAAYQERCAVCRLAHPELLDAAHILPDRDERGRPEVPNGLALCGVHHGAFDSHILGVDADYRLHIRSDVLKEHDGPMLLHGLQELHGTVLTLPRQATLYPNKGYLAERFRRFRAA